MRRRTRGAGRSLLAVALVLACASGEALAAPTAPDAARSRGAAGPAASGASPAVGLPGGLPLGSSKEPIVITSNQLEFDYQHNRVTYRGTVHATQDDLTIDSDTLIVTFDRADEGKQAELREVVAQGNVVITQGTRKATGETAVYSQPERKIVLLGNPVLRDGPNEITGDRLTVLLDEGRSVVESSAKKRVSAVLYPGSEPSGVGGGASERGSETAGGGAGSKTAKPSTAKQSAGGRP